MAAEPRGWELIFRCPNCQEYACTRLAVPIYVLIAGPSLVCGECLAIIAVTLTIAFPPPMAEEAYDVDGRDPDPGAA
jgi:hypothetical protein